MRNNTFKNVSYLVHVNDQTAYAAGNMSLQRVPLCEANFGSVLLTHFLDDCIQDQLFLLKISEDRIVLKVEANGNVNF